MKSISITLDAATDFQHTEKMDDFPDSINTRFTTLVGCRYPIIAAPMFLISNVAMVVAASNIGAVGGAPSLNWRTSAEFEKALLEISSATSAPYAINLIVNKSNPRLEEDLALVVKYQVPIVITSLGSPAKVIEAVHGYGGKVFCDVTTLAYALKVQSQGADGVVAVSSGAGGHAGPTSPMVLIPHLKEKLDIPVIAAGGIVTGRQILAALVLGADAVQIGTRFIASEESPASADYKQAVLNAEPEDIVLTSRISGTPAAVINTPYIQQLGTDLPSLEKFLRKNSYTAHLIKMLRYAKGIKRLESAATKPTWKNVWSAGQGVGLVHDIKPTAEIIRQMVFEYHDARKEL